MCASFFFSFFLPRALSLFLSLCLGLVFCDTFSNANDDECQRKVTPAALASFPHDCHSRMGQTNRLCPLFVAVLCVCLWTGLAKLTRFICSGHFTHVMQHTEYNVLRGITGQYAR